MRFDLLHTVNIGYDLCVNGSCAQLSPYCSLARPVCMRGKLRGLGLTGYGTFTTATRVLKKYAYTIT